MSKLHDSPFICAFIVLVGPGGGQYMTVVNPVSPKVVPTRGKQFVIQNNSQSGNQGPQQIVLQPENGSGQQLVIPNSAAIGNLIPRGAGVVFQNSNNQIIQGNKIFIQQSAQGPVILVRFRTLHPYRIERFLRAISTISNWSHKPVKFCKFNKDTVTNGSTSSPTRTSG